VNDITGDGRPEIISGLEGTTRLFLSDRADWERNQSDTFAGVTVKAPWYDVASPPTLGGFTADGAVTGQFSSRGEQGNELVLSDMNYGEGKGEVVLFYGRGSAELWEDFFADRTLGELLVNDAAVSLQGGNPDDNFGARLCNLGDADDDDQMELGVGAPGADNETGEFHVYSASDEGAWFDEEDPPRSRFMADPGESEEFRAFGGSMFCAPALPAPVTHRPHGVLLSDEEGRFWWWENETPE